VIRAAVDTPVSVKIPSKAALLNLLELKPVTPPRPSHHRPQQMTARIPQPPTVPFLGNVTALDKDLPQKSFSLLAEAYGEIYQLNLLGTLLRIILLPSPHFLPLHRDTADLYQFARFAQ
jgi:hypothetical protein